MTGMLSYGAIVAPHVGHFERPLTHGSPRGTRYATTVAKLPRISPAGRARMADNVSSIQGGGSVVWALHRPLGGGG